MVSVAAGSCIARTLPATAIVTPGGRSAAPGRERLIDALHRRPVTRMYLALPPRRNDGMAISDQTLIEPALAAAGK